MPLTLALVATITREADETVATVRVPLRVDGDRVLMVVKQTGALPELWRSDDRGATWTFHSIGAAGLTVDPSNLVRNQGFWWVYKSNAFRRTPEGDPGAGGFVDTPLPSTNPHTGWDVANGAVHISRNFDNTLLGPVALAGEPPATPSVGAVDNFLSVRAIPGAANDLLMLRQQANPPVYRVRVSPFSIVQTVLLTGTDDVAAQPYPNVAALSATDYWASTDRDVEPSKSWQSTDGGASYAQRNLAANFWDDVPGVTLDRRKGHFAGFVRFAGVDYCFNRYLDAGGNPAQSGLHLRLCRFASPTWERESNRITDGFPIVHAGAGVNALGNLDFYVTTYDAALNNTRVYRTTAIAPSGGGSKIPRLRH